VSSTLYPDLCRDIGVTYIDSALTGSFSKKDEGLNFTLVVDVEDDILSPVETDACYRGLSDP